MASIHHFTLRGLFTVLAAGACLALCPCSARADLVLNGCGTVTIVEGDHKLMMCTLLNNGPNDVQIGGVLVFAVPRGPDRHDNIVRIAGVGVQEPEIDAGQSHTFQYMLYTPPPDNGEVIDYGANVVNALYSGTDLVTGAFVKGSYKGGVAFVLDQAGVQTPTTPRVPNIPIRTPGQYERDKERVGKRGFVTVTPEPEAILLMMSGLGLLLVLHRAPVRLRVRLRNLLAR